MTSIRKSKQLQDIWKKYQKQYEYAKDISFEDTCNSIEQLLLCINSVTD